MNKSVDWKLTKKIDIPHVYVVYDNRLGWIAEYDYDGHYSNLCFMTHNKNEIMQDDIDAVRTGILSVLV